MLKKAESEIIVDGEAFLRSIRKQATSARSGRCDENLHVAIDLANKSLAVLLG